MQIDISNLLYATADFYVNLTNYNSTYASGPTTIEGSTTY